MRGKNSLRNGVASAEHSDARFALNFRVIFQPSFRPTFAFISKRTSERPSNASGCNSTRNTSDLVGAHPGSNCVTLRGRWLLILVIAVSSKRQAPSAVRQRED